jgi:hypothetical protein
LTAADHNLCLEISRALGEQPFAGTVEVFGQRLSRPMARAMERMLLRQRVSERSVQHGL